MNLDIDSIKRKLLIKYPFFGSIVANLNFVATKNVARASTDGKNVNYNPDYINGLTEDEQTFVFAHEVCHVAFDHILRSEGKDRRTWNIATDSVINAFLKHDGLTFVPNVVDIPEAINFNAEQMYEKLMKEKENQKQQQNSQRKSSSGENNNENNQSDSQNKDELEDDNKEKQSSIKTSDSKDKEQAEPENNPNSNHKEGTSKGKSDSQKDGNDSQDKEKSEVSNSSSSSEIDESSEEKTNNVGHDDHDLWEKAIEEKKKRDAEKPKDKEESQSNEETEEEKRLTEQIKKFSELGEKKIFEQNKIERKRRLEELRQALAEESLGAGKDANSNVRNVTNIGVADPLIDWRKLLKEAVKFDVDWSYRNASIEDGVVTSYLEEIPMPETEIVLDTSGSINDVLLKDFLRECKNIFQNSRVKVGCFDTMFYGFTEVKSINDIDNLNFIGGGGTNFNVAVNAFSRRVENKIIFTDGKASMPSKSLDAIWIVFGNRKINPPGGRVIYIDEQQLRNMINLDYGERKR